MSNNKIEEIIKFSCAYFGVSKDYILGHSINRDVAIARHIMWYVLHVKLGVPTSDLAKAFNRTRRNIFIGVDKIKSGCKKQKFYKDALLKFETEYEKYMPHE